jgi:hypothetical protein
MNLDAKILLEVAATDLQLQFVSLFCRFTSSPALCEFNLNTSVELRCKSCQGVPGSCSAAFVSHRRELWRCRRGEFSWHTQTFEKRENMAKCIAL